MGLNEKKIEELLYLLVFGVLEVKSGLDRTVMNKIDKNGKKLHVLECALPGSPTIGPLA